MGGGYSAQMLCIKEYKKTYPRFLTSRNVFVFVYCFNLIILPVTDVRRKETKGKTLHTYTLILNRNKTIMLKRCTTTARCKIRREKKEKRRRKEKK